MKVSVEDVFKCALQQYAQGLLVSVEHKRAQPTNRADGGFCVAYSGGLDSTVLLHIAYEFCKQENIALAAVHVNHGISPNAGDWQIHCQTQCAQKNIPFYTQSLILKKTAQQSLEADARNARYHILDEFAGLDKTVLLAQHQNDQAETLLLQLNRGAGIKGLAAMPQLITRESGVQYLRPLLDVARADILVYAKRHELSWLEDESNQDNSYDRNFLRNQVLPLLIDRWPSFSKTVARSARHCGRENEVNTEYMKLLSECLIENNSIDLSELNKHSNATQECFVRYWLSSDYGLAPTSAQLKDIVTMAKVSNNTSSHPLVNSSPHIILANNVIERYKDKLLVMPLVKQSPQTKNTIAHAMPVQIQWNNKLVIKLNESYTLKKVEANCANKPNVFLLPDKGVQYIFGGSNLGFKYKKNRPTKTIKSWYQEWAISPMQRQQIPVFICDDKAIAIGLDPIRESCIDVKPTIYVELCRSILS